MYRLTCDVDRASLDRVDDSLLLENNGVAKHLGADVVVRCGSHGLRGLFAARSFVRGERVLIESAFIWQRKDAELWTPNGLLPDDIDAALLQLAPLGATRGGALPHEPPRTRRSVLEAALAANAFGVGAAAASSAAGASGQGGDGRALFLLISMANHSCMANCRTLQVEDDSGADVGAPPRRVLEARRDIAEGDELCICYVPATWARPVRAAQLSRLWKFECSCSRCCGAVDDTIVHRCEKCDDGRVYGGASACADCHADAAAIGGQNEDAASSLEALAAPGSVREVVDRLLRHPRLAFEDVRIWLTACELLQALSPSSAAAKQVRVRARAAALRMVFVEEEEWSCLDTPMPMATQADLD
jgi:hypothetical protein